MSFRPRFILALFLSITLTACSSSPPSTEGSEGTSPPPAESGSDVVGNTAEDMLKNEQVAEVPPATEESTDTDPFSDLKKQEEAPQPEAMATIESGEVTPVAEPSDTPSPKESVMGSYKVKRGDTLMKIAFSLYGDIDRWKDLLEWNRDRLKSPNRLSPGIDLQYEPSGDFKLEELSHSYVIKKGDTLANISDEIFGRRSKYRKLQKFNARLIKNPHVIFAGFTLYYDITPKEMAEAETRRQQRALENKAAEAAPTPPIETAPSQPAAPAPVDASTPASAPAPASEVPSAITGPGVESGAPPPVVVAPAAPQVSGAPPAAGASPAK